MKIVISYPPNIEKIRARFDLTGKNVVFTYGQALYNPGGSPIPEHLMVHEETHERQQGSKIEEWWGRYLKDDQFRLSQEVEAYKNQYQYVCQNESRQVKRDFLRHIAQDLSSKIYGNIINFEQAKQLILN